ncbi:MAG: threonine synthase [Leptospiraceae bacterium]|nr:threonine synthase [Leptospiraceae bacterium]
MKARAWFESIDKPDSRYSLDEVIYTCPKTGSLLQVNHDLELLKQKSAEDWKSLFKKRATTQVHGQISGVWSKKEWVLPDLPEEHIVTMGEGYSALFQSERLNRLFKQADLRVKLCGNSHTGSFKDLGMTVLVSQVKSMIAQGKPIHAVACASTGDTSAALAAYAAHADIPAIILLPAGKISIAQLIQPVANGATVLALDTDFDGCMKIVKQLTATPEIYLANSMNSLRIEGQKTVGIEVVEQMNWEVPDWFVIPGGNLGNVSALGNGLLMLKALGLINKLPRIAVAQAQKANPLYLSFLNEFDKLTPVTAGETQASAIRIGDPVSYPKAVKTLREFNGVVGQATEAELSEASALADLSGLFCDPHTGVALAVLQKLQADKTIRPDESVVVISTANGLKFTDFKTGYHRNTLPEVEAKQMNRPVEVKATLEAVKAAVMSKIEEFKK